MNRVKVAIILTFAFALAVSVIGIAQQKSTEGQTAEQQRGAMMSQMGAMMEQCRQHCQATSNTIDQLNKIVDEAKRSNDPAKMRAALESVQKPLADMKNHMSMCMSNMNMMENMRGKMMGEQKNKAPEKK
jgi:hypothetical protein